MEERGVKYSRGSAGRLSADFNKSTLGQPGALPGADKPKPLCDAAKAAKAAPGLTSAGHGICRWLGRLWRL
jgi:hypothetical protein